MGQRELALAHVLTGLLESEDNQRTNHLDAFTFDSYLQQHLKQPIQLDVIAREFGLSKSSLCRIIPKLTGMTVVQNFETARIEKAKALLQSGVFNVSGTGQRVGYEDPYYFSKVFKKHTGFSPRRWKQSSSPAN